MTTRRRATPIPGRLAFLALLIAAAAAQAGPARYDPATRSVRIAYTFAEIPSFGMTAEQLQALGSRQNPTEDQEAYIRALIKDAGTVLHDVTGGRANIAPLDYVDNVKDADMVITLTTDPGRGGWAMLGTIEGRPGQIGLYYKVLKKTPREQSALTVAHELAHYLFALPDEYASGGGRGVCPRVNPQGPGCLMDNYFQRGGHYGRFCDDDHNASAPSPATLIHGHKADESCQYWVDRFFQLRSSSSAEPSDPSKVEIATIRPDQPFTGRFRALMNAATIFARGEIDRLDIGKSRRTLDPGASELRRVRRIAGKFLDEQIRFLRNDLDFIKPTGDQVKTALEIVARNAFTNPAGGAIEATAYLGKGMIERLRVKAREIAASKELSASAPRTELLLAGTTNETERELKKLQPAISAVKRELLAYLRGSELNYKIGSSPGPDTLGPEEQRIIEAIAREAVLGTADTSEFGLLSEAAKLHMGLSAVTARNLVDISTFLDIPGAESRLDELRGYDERLSRFALPGKTFSGFGRRKTLIAAPAPLDPRNDTVRIDAGGGMPYDRIRRLAVSQLTRLIDRERVEVVDQMLLDPLSASDGGDRFQAMNRMVAHLSTETRQNRVENIIIISPPGGLPRELSDELESLRKRIQKNGDVRLDVIEMFSGSLPLRLRDQVHVSGGSVQFVSDIDELGATAQRLKNDISAGSWVSAPEFGVIDLGPRLAESQLIGNQAGESLGSFWWDIRTRYGGSIDGETPGLLQTMIHEIDSELFSRFEDITSSHLPQSVLPADFDRVRTVYTQLHDLKARIAKINRAVVKMGYGEPPESTSIARNEIRAALDTIQDMFWPEAPGNFLARTDDALDGQMRRSLRDRARRLEEWAQQLRDGEATLSQEIENERRLLENAKDAKTKLAHTENYNFLKYYKNVIQRNEVNLRSRAGAIRQCIAERDRVVAELQHDLIHEARAIRRLARERWEIGDSLRDYESALLASNIRLWRAFVENCMVSQAGPGFVPSPRTLASPAALRLEEEYDRLVDGLEDRKKEWTIKKIALEADLKRKLGEFAIKNKQLNDATSARIADAPGDPDDLIAIADNVAEFIRLNASLMRDELSVPYILPPPADESCDEVIKNDKGEAEEALRSEIQRWIADGTFQFHLVLTALEQAANAQPDPVKLNKSIESLQDLMDSCKHWPAWRKSERDGFMRRVDAVRAKGRALSSAPKKPSHTLAADSWNGNLELSNPLAMLTNSILLKDVTTSTEGKGNPASENEVFSNEANLSGIKIQELLKGETKILSETQRLNKVLKSIPCHLDTESLPGSANTRVAEVLGFLEKARAANSPPRKYISDPEMTKQGVDDRLKVLQSTYEKFQDNRHFSAGTVKLLASLEGGQRELDQLQHDLVRDWVEQTTLEIYPRTMHVILERLRDLDAKLRLLDRAVAAQPDERPVFERIKERRKAAEIDFDATGDGKHAEITFGSFQAEEGADYELILGLSRPLSNFEKFKSNENEHPKLRLHVDGKLVDRPYLRLEPDLSSETMLVFRAPKPDLRAGLLGAGRYTPKLLIKHEYMPLVGGDARISYTFSVGTRRPNVQILAAIRQPQAKDGDHDPAKDPEFAFRGVLAADKLEAIIEAEVFAGAPVLNAEVTSTLQRIDRTNLGIDTPNYVLRDDGIYPDLLKGDGVYTARITLEPAARRTAAEYRVMIQARSTTEVKFIPLADPIIGLQDDEKEEDREPPPVPPFQRSTSLNFHAAQES